MPVQSDDLFLLQRGTDLKKITYEQLIENVEGGAPVTISDTAPADPSEGDLWWADSDEDEGGGRLYVWTGSEWVDTSLPGNALDVDTGDARYLSRLNNDTAEGEITFNATSIHKDGVSVTGGDATSVDTGMCLSGGRPAIAKDGIEAAVFNPQGNSQFTVASYTRDKTLAGLQGISCSWASANHGNQTIDLFYGPITVDTNTSGTVNGVRIIPGTTQNRYWTVCWI